MSFVLLSREFIGPVPSIPSFYTSSAKAIMASTQEYYLRDLNSLSNRHQYVSLEKNQIPFCSPGLLKGTNYLVAG
jgi:hypothetical protein